MRGLARTLGLLAALLSAGAAAGAPDLPKGILALEGRPAPPLALSDMDGRAFDLREARGGWVFVHFWASWCGPCRREMPSIERMAAQMEDEGLRVVLINTAEDADTIFSFLGAVAPGLDSLMDRNGLTTEGWAPRGLPATFLVDPEGRVRYQALGGRPWDQPPYLRFLRSLSGD